LAESSAILRKFSGKKRNSVQISSEVYVLWLAEIMKLANQIKPFLANNKTKYEIIRG
jgi:hypothetical protein